MLPNLKVKVYATAAKLRANDIIKSLDKFKVYLIGGGSYSINSITRKTFMLLEVQLLMEQHKLNKRIF